MHASCRSDVGAGTRKKPVTGGMQSLLTAHWVGTNYIVKYVCVWEAGCVGRRLRSQQEAGAEKRGDMTLCQSVYRGKL